MAVLHDVKGEREFPLRGKVTLIGRDPACDIVVESKATSGRHAMILHAGDDFFIEDLDSLNGTYVNGQRIRQRTRLRNDDLIELLGLAVNFRKEAVGADGALDSTARTGPPLAPGTASILSSVEIRGDLRLTVKPEAKLRTVLEIAQNLGATLDLKEVLPKVLESLFATFPQADCGFILLLDPTTGILSQLSRGSSFTAVGEATCLAVSGAVN